MSDAPVNRILSADATKAWAIPDRSIDTIITSPPYWHHRDNGPTTTTVFDGSKNCSHDWKEGSGKNEGETCGICHAWKGQLGQEGDPRDYIRHLVDIFTHDGRRVLKDTGELWVNLGDSYAKEGKENWLQPKQKLLIPSRFAAAMQDAGWVVRNDIVWAKSVAFSDESSKGGGLPSSVHSRFNVSHEYFFFFVKPESDRRQYYVSQSAEIVSWNRDGREDWDVLDYYSRLDNVRLKPKWVNADGERTDLYGRTMGSRPNAGGSPKQHAAGQPHLYMYNHPLGKNPGSVWQFHTEPFEGEHNSPFPSKLIQWIIRFSCPERACPNCGLPEEKFYDRKEKRVRSAKCTCDSELRPGTVLDPFMGSGTTGIAALREHRNFLGMEMNPHYLAVCEQRIREEFPDSSLKTNQSILA